MTLKLRNKLTSNYIIDKANLFSVNYALVNYSQAAEVLSLKAVKRESFGLTALAVHGLVEAVWDKELNQMVRKIDMVVPDGQPIRWALNFFYRANLKDRVYGPTLTLHVLAKADELKLKVYLYGSTEPTLDKLKSFINIQYPRVEVCGMHIDRFREASPEEDAADIEKINASGAHIVLVGRGCPRQERWVANHLGKVNAVMMAVGAAFDFHAGNVSQAPAWMQNNGLEWLFRFIKEPQRLWRRYLYTNSYFIYLFIRGMINSSFQEKHKQTI